MISISHLSQFMYHFITTRVYVMLKFSQINAIKVANFYGAEIVHSVPVGYVEAEDVLYSI